MADPRKPVSGDAAPEDTAVALLRSLDYQVHVVQQLTEVAAFMADTLLGSREEKGSSTVNFMTGHEADLFAFICGLTAEKAGDLETQLRSAIGKAVLVQSEEAGQ